MQNPANTGDFAPKGSGATVGATVRTIGERIRWLGATPTLDELRLDPVTERNWREATANWKAKQRGAGGLDLAATAQGVMGSTGENFVSRGRARNLVVQTLQPLAALKNFTPKKASARSEKKTRAEYGFAKKMRGGRLSRTR